MVEAAQGGARDADGGGEGLPQRTGRRTLRDARRLEDQLGMARPAAGGLGFHQAEEILRDDHSERTWRARFLALCAFGSRAQALLAFADRRRDRDGAELAWAGRAADALWHQRAAGPLASSVGGWPRHSLLRSHQSGGRLRCRLDDRLRRDLQGQLRRQGSAWASSQLAQALYHPRSSRHPVGARLQGLRSRIIS